MIKYIFAAFGHVHDTDTYIFLLSPKIAVVLGQKNTKWKWQFSGKSTSSSGEWIVVLQHGFLVFCAILPLYRETTDIRRPVHVFGFTLVQAKNKWLMVFEMNLEIFWCACCAHWHGVSSNTHPSWVCMLCTWKELYFSYHFWKLEILKKRHITSLVPLPN